MTTIGTGRVARPVSSPAEVTIWDPLVRIFHWSLVAFFVLAWATADRFDRLHELAGYAVLALVVSRVLWGFVGSKHARFRDFVKAPSLVCAYLADLARLRAQRYLGHNPAGGVMIVLLLVMLLAISVTGVLMTTDAFWGVKWVEEAHEIAVNVTLGLIGLHLIGVAVSSLLHGENLVRAMVTGRKRER